MASSTASRWPHGTRLFGTALVFVGAYLLEKTKGLDGAARRSCACWPCCPWPCPGWCWAWATSSSSTRPDNPLNWPVPDDGAAHLCTIVHFYTTGHLTAVTALKALDAEFESVSRLAEGAQFYTTFWRVTLPICTPALVDIARYFFVNAMTTISAVVFLYSPETKVASIAILNLDEAGEIGAMAAACAVLIAAAWRTTATLLFMALPGWWRRGGVWRKRTQAWRAAAAEARSAQDSLRRPPNGPRPILLTPGPLTTTLRTKLAMLKDWGSVGRRATSARFVL